MAILIHCPSDTKSVSKRQISWNFSKVVLTPTNGTAGHSRMVNKVFNHGLLLISRLLCLYTIMVFLCTHTRTGVFNWNNDCGWNKIKFYHMSSSFFKEKILEQRSRKHYNYVFYISQQPPSAKQFRKVSNCDQQIYKILIAIKWSKKYRKLYQWHVTDAFKTRETGLFMWESTTPTIKNFMPTKRLTLQNLNLNLKMGVKLIHCVYNVGLVDWLSVDPCFV